MEIYRHTESVHNLETPRHVVPEIVRQLQPKSVLDVGCGIGTWLKVFEEQGVVDILGLDGEHVDRSLLKINPNQFKVQNLLTTWSLSRKFDLVVSLEVAEHLPEHVSDSFVETLVKHGNSILFSAAIPKQDGQNHLNEQWPSYWQEKFRKHGFYFHDVLRHLFWGNPEVQWWYSQNMFLITDEPQFKPILSLVHPSLFLERTRVAEAALEGDLGVKLSASILMKALRKWIGKKRRLPVG